MVLIEQTCTERRMQDYMFLPAFSLQIRMLKLVCTTRNILYKIHQILGKIYRIFSYYTLVGFLLQNVKLGVILKKDLVA